MSSINPVKVDYLHVETKSVGRKVGGESEVNVMHVFWIHGVTYMQNIETENKFS